MKFKNIAFTLAETLVVMGIIGVIAALTIPNLSQSTGNRENIVKLKKAYSELNEAFNRATAIYGPYENWPFDFSSAPNMTNLICSRLTEFMKISSPCTQEASGTNIYNFITADGYKVRMGAWMHGAYPDTYYFIHTKKNGKIVNGKTGFYIYSEPNDNHQSIHYRDKENFSSLLSDVTNCASNCTEVASVDSATAWVLKYDNMDYLKLKSDGTCPNGTTPTESNPRCN